MFLHRSIPYWIKLKAESCASPDTITTEQPGLRSGFFSFVDVQLE
jgi:hypothetical protein